MQSNNLTTDQTDPPPYPALTKLYCPMCASKGFHRVLCSVMAASDVMIVRSCQHCKSVVVFQVVKIPLENPVPN